MGHAIFCMPRQASKIPRAETPEKALGSGFKVSGGSGSSVQGVQGLGFRV